MLRWMKLPDFRIQKLRVGPPGVIELVRLVIAVTPGAGAGATQLWHWLRPRIRIPASSPKREAIPTDAQVRASAT